MIQSNCTNCKSLLQIDDAFAGGVCRCRHCGTIQTVPKRLKTASTVGVGETSANDPPSFTPANKRGAPEPFGPAGSGTGLDDLAGIVASSGLTSGRLQKKAAAADPDKKVAPTWDRKIVAIVASAAAVILILLGVIIFLAVHRTDGEDTQIVDTTTHNPTPPSNPPPSETPRTSVPAPTNQLANIFDVNLTETTITYVIDRGASSGDDGRLESVKAALIRSLKTLGPERRFQVLFWTVEKTGDVPSWPKSGAPQVATPANIAKVQALMDEEIYPHGATEPNAALTKALKNRPDVVVLIPIKGYEGDLTSFTQTVFDLRRSIKSDVKIHCFSLAQPQWKPALEKIASVTGGEYKDIPLTKLHEYAGQ